MIKASKEAITLKQIGFVLFAFIFSIANTRASDKLPNSSLGFGENRNPPSPLHSYFGIEPGFGQASGARYAYDSGYAYGATAGLELNKAFGAALTYQHNGFSYAQSGVKSRVHQLLLELNVFSLLVLNGGFHGGDVIKLEPGYRTSDLGLGAHVGIDVSLTSHITAGVTGYWTLVLESEDHHSLINLMVPLKFWF